MAKTIELPIPTDAAERVRLEEEGNHRYRVRIIEVLRKYGISLDAAPLDAVAMAVRRLADVQTLSLAKADAKLKLYAGTYVPLSRLQEARGLGIGKIYIDPDLSDDEWFVVTDADAHVVEGNRQ